MDEYDVGSDKYLEMYDKLQDVSSSISGIVKNMHEWNKELLSLPINSISDQLTGLSEALDAFQAIQNDHETVIAAVTDAINEQTEALEEQRDAETEAAQSEIDALQEKLDLLQKQNDERKIQLALEQAKYDLERAQNQIGFPVLRRGGHGALPSGGDPPEGAARLRRGAALAGLRPAPAGREATGGVCGPPPPRRLPRRETPGLPALQYFAIL